MTREPDNLRLLNQAPSAFAFEGRVIHVSFNG